MTKATIYYIDDSGKLAVLQVEQDDIKLLDHWLCVMGIKNGREYTISIPRERIIKAESKKLP